MRVTPLYIFIFLCLSFIAYSLSIYISHPSENKKNNEAAAGRLVWQKYNCQACHQLYGLGGYLGPDLTNLVSENGKDESYIKAMVRTGTRQMPAFDISDEETKQLIIFLTSTNESGIADPRRFDIRASGMIEQQ